MRFVRAWSQDQIEECGLKTKLRDVVSSPSHGMWSKDQASGCGLKTKLRKTKMVNPYKISLKFMNSSTRTSSLLLRMQPSVALFSRNFFLPSTINMLFFFCCRHL